MGRPSELDLATITPKLEVAESLGIYSFRSKNSRIGCQWVITLWNPLEWSANQVHIPNTEGVFVTWDNHDNFHCCWTMV
jgi:hypothetical protein